MLTKEFLEENYVGKRLSILATVMIAGCSQVKVVRWLREFDIPVRSKSESMIGKVRTLEQRRHMAEVMVGKGSGVDSFKWVDYGSKCYDADGYIRVKIEGRGWLLEHRYIIEQEIGRMLQLDEIGHHINGVKDDNRIKNLMLFISHSAHRRFHLGQGLVRPEEIIFDGRLFSLEYLGD